MRGHAAPVEATTHDLVVLGADRHSAAVLERCDTFYSSPRKSRPKGWQKRAARGIYCHSSRLELSGSAFTGRPYQRVDIAAMLRLERAALKGRTASATGAKRVFAPTPVCNMVEGSLARPRTGHPAGSLAKLPVPAVSAPASGGQALSTGAQARNPMPKPATVVALEAAPRGERSWP